MSQYYRMRGDHWESAYMELDQLRREDNERILARVDEIEGALEAERVSHRAELRRAKSPGFGFFAGPSVTHNGNFEVVAGFGLVWKLDIQFLW